MSEQTPQPPQDERIDTDASAVEDAPVTEAPADSDTAPQISYHEYLKLLNPEKSDAEIAKMIRKENRYTWLVRFQLLAVVVFVVLILVFIFIR